MIERDSMQSQESKKAPKITPELLFEDNHSKDTKVLREEWEGYRDEGMLTLILRCSDSRIVLPNPQKARSIRTIAAGGLKEPYRGVFENETVEQILILAHHDGETIKPHKMPEGCGGLKAKGSTENGKEYLTGIQAYVAQEVEHPDVIMHAWRSAAETAIHTNKSILAATQDHLTGEIVPLAVYSNHGRNLTSAVNPLLLDEDRYDPKSLYANGIPSLTQEELPYRFRDYLKEYSIQLKKLHRTHPNLSKTQKIQSPSILVITDRTQPLEGAYPRTMSEPNTTFKLSVARTTGKPDISDASIERSLNQAEYPIEHFPIQSVFIETFDMGISEKIARKILRKNWMEKRSSSIDLIVGQANHGVLEDIKLF